MLFNVDIEPSCLYCYYGTKLDADEIICIKRGIMAGSGSCSAFRYEPTKRVPEALPRLDDSGLSEDDFSL